MMSYGHAALFRLPMPRRTGLSATGLNGWTRRLDLVSVRSAQSISAGLGSLGLDCLRALF
eukprot:SAG31_NODE_9179_length_1320_cov_1.782146_1_plen_60_part_00